jgi:hypothetical protein
VVKSSHSSFLKGEFALTDLNRAMVHHVFFWLKNPDSPEDLAALIAGVQSLAEIPGVRLLHVGVPAPTIPRPVIDNSYSVSELLFFDDVEAEAVYQEHPLHQKFIAECSPLWNKVLVYDSVVAESPIS